MYIKSTTNSAGAVYYHLVESYWENGKSRQRTLLSLGKASDNKLDELAHAISKHKDFISIIDLAKRKNDREHLLGSWVSQEGKARGGRGLTLDLISVIDRFY